MWLSFFTLMEVGTFASDVDFGGLFLGELATLAEKMSCIPWFFSFAFAACLQNVPGAPLSAQTDQLGVASVHLTRVCHWSLPKRPQ